VCVAECENCGQPPPPPTPHQLTNSYPLSLKPLEWPHSVLDRLNLSSQPEKEFLSPTVGKSARLPGAWGGGGWGEGVNQRVTFALYAIKYMLQMKGYLMNKSVFVENMYLRFRNKDRISSVGEKTILTTVLNIF